MSFWLVALALGIVPVSSYAAEIGSKPHCRGDGDEIQLGFHLYGKNEKGASTDVWYGLSCFGLGKKCVGASLDLGLPLAKENPASQTGLWRLIKAEGRVYQLKGSYKLLTIDLRRKSITLLKGQGKKRREAGKGYCP